MAREHRSLTKAEWVEALGRRMDQWSNISNAQRWLCSRLAYYCEEIPDDRRLKPEDIVDIIHNQTRQELAEPYSQRGTRISYTDYISDFGTVSNEAWIFSLRLVEICRHIGGDDVGELVYGLVLADRSAIWRYTLDFLADVFTPLYIRIEDALLYENSITIYLGDVELVAYPLYAGRAGLSISRTYRDDDQDQKTTISLSGGDFKPDGSGLALTGASGPSLAAVLRTLELATRAYRALDEEGKDALFVKYRVSANVQ